ncbi:MAG: Gfo/Idh/MocA family oxidoreductase [Actinobacteria bacterium]|nr:Gfo/Idh/MocA family oxidoreductase [Actinomycetota bacterium]
MTGVRLRWVVVGFGDFGQRHARTLVDADQEVVALVEPDSARRADAALQHPEATVVGQLDDARAVAHDAVVVATPETMHRDPVVQALRHAHVLVEKPIATDLHDARAMVDAATAGGTLLFVGHLLRFDPRLVALRGMIESGSLGRIVHVSSRRHGFRSSAHVYQRVQPLVLSGVHDADLVLWLTGLTPVSVSASAVSALDLQTPDHQIALIELAGGASALVEAGRLLPDGATVAPNFVLEVIGTEATARLVDDGDLVVVDREGTAPVPVVGGWTPADMLRVQCDHVLQCIAAGRPSPLIDPAFATASLATMLAAAESAGRGGERVTIAR